MERITGPVRGHYIASLASDMEAGADSGRFLGYAKICRRRPDHYWDASCLVKICGARLHASAADALAEVEALAVRQLQEMSKPAEPASA